MTLPKLLTDISKVKRKKPKKVPYNMDPDTWALTGPNDYAKLRRLFPKDYKLSPYEERQLADARMKGDWYEKHYLTDEDSWKSLATVAGYPNPQLLVRMNFGIGIDVVGRPNGEELNFEEVNWLMEVYCGCNRTRDGLNFSFSASAKAKNPGKGFIWMPKPFKKGADWPPKPKYEPIDCNIYPLKPGALVKYKVSKRGNLFGGGHIDAGAYYASEQGVRYVLSANSQEIIFVLVEAFEPKYKPLLGVAMAQSNGILCGRSELDVSWKKDVGRKGQSLKKVAEWELSLMMGMLAAGGASIRLGIATAESIDFLLSDKSRKYELQLLALGTTIAELAKLRKTSPALFDLFMGGLFAEAKKQWGEAAFTDPTGALAGFVIGEAGPEVLAGRFSALKYVADVCEKLSKELGSKLAKTARDKAIADYTKDSAGFAARLQQAGIVYTPGTEQELMDEIAKHPKAIEDAMARIAAAYAAVK